MGQWKTSSRKKHDRGSEASQRERQLEGDPEKVNMQWQVIIDERNEEKGAWMHEALNFSDMNVDLRGQVKFSMEAER